MNFIGIIGRLTKDYEVKYTSSGKAIGNFTLAVDTGWGDNKQTSFFDVAVFGNSVEHHKDYISKGSKVAIEGSLRQERWEAKDGTKRSVIKIVANRIDYLDAKKQEGFGNSADDSDPPF